MTRYKLFTALVYTMKVKEWQVEGKQYTVFPRIVRARSINFTVCVMRGLFEGVVYSEGANYSRKYGIQD